MAVGIREMTELEVAGSSADAIKYFATRCIEEGIPVVTPPGGLACHVDAMRFIPHVPQSEYPAGALAAAVYITSGIRGMERGSSVHGSRSGRQRRSFRSRTGPPGRAAPYFHYVAL